MNRFKYSIFICISLIIIMMIIGYYFYNINKQIADTSSQKIDMISEVFINKTIKDEDEEIERIIVILNRKDEELESKTESNYDLNSNNEQISKNTYDDQQNDQSNNIKTNTNIPNNKYFIKVNYKANVVNVFTFDENGNYTVPIKAMCCSTGNATPKSGTYSIKQKWTWLALFGNVYGHYVTQITGNILFHSVPYLENGNSGSLEYWEYDKLRDNLFSWLR